MRLLSIYFSYLDETFISLSADQASISDEYGLQELCFPLVLPLK